MRDPFRVRTAEERIADPEWSRPKSRLLLLPVLSLGTLTFAWFWIRGKLDPDDNGRYELWAVVWGVVNAASMPYGAGLLFGTPDELVASSVVWLLRLTSIIHAWAANRDRLERIARREVGTESAMMALAANSSRSQPDSVPRFPTYGAGEVVEPQCYQPAPPVPGVPAAPAPTDLDAAPAPARPRRPAPPVDPTRAARVVETPPDRAAPTVGNAPVGTVPDLEPEASRWTPEPPRADQRRGPRGRRLDL